MIDFISEKCDYCGVCVSVCPVDSIILRESALEITDACTVCDLCVHVCPYEALVH